MVKKLMAKDILKTRRHGDTICFSKWATIGNESYGLKKAFIHETHDI